MDAEGFVGQKRAEQLVMRRNGRNGRHKVAANGGGNAARRRNGVRANAAPLTEQNVRAIAELEKAALQDRSPAQRVGDAVSRWVSSPLFVLLHAAGFLGWILANTGVFGLRPLDPFPFTLLTMIVSLEAIFLSSFVLMSQERMSRQADHRAHMDLQINLLAEQESTKMLELMSRIATRLGVRPAVDPQLDTMLEDIDPRDVDQQLKREMTQS
jgi:uncharacterized membrane protein